MAFENLKIPKLIYQTKSKYNERIEVYQVGKTRKLSVNGFVQSVSPDAPHVDRRVWGKLVRLVKEKRPDAKTILLFGLGGGTMAHLFNREMPGAHVTAVEIDEVMVDVARKYFDLDTLKNLKIIVADAMRVLAEHDQFELYRGSFDVVIIDIYCGDKYPDLGESGSFFSNVRTLTRKGGLNIYNRIYIKEHQSDVNEFNELLEEMYDNVDSVTVAGRTNSDNILIYGEV